VWTRQDANDLLRRRCSRSLVIVFFIRQERPQEPQERRQLQQEEKARIVFIVGVVVASPAQDYTMRQPHAAVSAISDTAQFCMRSADGSHIAVGTQVPPTGLSLWGQGPLLELLLVRKGVERAWQV
jgi:hypothetical protein